MDLHRARAGAELAADLLGVQYLRHGGEYLALARTWPAGAMGLGVMGMLLALLSYYLF